MSDLAPFYLDRLQLNGLLIEKNKEFVEALKQKQPHGQLMALHSEIQELYNHISQLKEEKVERTLTGELCNLCSG